MRDLIFVDTESTGLADDPDAEIVELTWATLTSEPETIYFGVNKVSQFIDDLIGFTKRGIAGRRSDFSAYTRFLAASEGQTIVAANPAHDMHFIKQAGLWRFHYRMLDIQTYAFAKARVFNDIPSMKDIHDLLVNLGHNITAPDHTSRNDVLAMRDAFFALEKM